MRRFLLAGIALPLLVAPAFSQSSSTPSTTAPGTVNPVTPRAGQAMPSGPSTVPSTTATPAPMMAPGTATGLAPGANSFTENQARTRLMEKGYTAVSALKKDKDGVWRGTAMKDSRSVAVGVDYKGDISGG